jgi:hypothetical protein
MLAAPLASDPMARHTPATFSTGSLTAWARHHGLHHEGAGTLPRATPRLRAGLGLGSRRSLGRDVEPIANTITTELCAGRLPGGVEGVLAHRSHVAEERRECVAFTATVVVVELGCSARGAAAPAGAGHAGMTRAGDVVYVDELELERGHLTVWANRELTEPADLDALCRVAATIARTIRARASRRRRPMRPRRGITLTSHVLL